MSGVNGETELADRAAADLRQERIQLELHGLGREHLFEQPVFAREHAKQRQVSVVADGENVGARTLRVRKLLPRRSVPSREFSILNGPARRSSIAQNDQIWIACSRRGRLLQPGLQGALQIGAATQATGAHGVDRALNAGRRPPR